MSRRPGRGLTITVVVVVVLLALLTVVDRVAVRLVADEIATQAQRSEDLATRPEVSIDGFPFLSQVVAGDYRHVQVDVRGVVEQGLRVDRVHADLSHVRLPLGDVARGDLQRVPVDRLTAQVELTFDDLNAYLRAQRSIITLSPAGQAIRVTGTPDLAGINVPLSGTADVGVQPDAVVFTPRELSGSLGALLPPALLASATQLLTVRVPVGALPFNLQLSSATVSADRIVFAAAGENVIIDPNAVRGAPSS